MPTSYIHTNTFNLILQNISVTGNNKALTDFQESLNRRKLHTPIVMMTWAPVVPKGRTKCWATLQGALPKQGAHNPAHSTWVRFLLRSLATISVIFLFSFPSILALCLPWPFGESGIPSMSDSCQVTPALSMGSCSAEPIQDLEI